MKTIPTLTAVAITLSVASARQDTECPCLTAADCKAAAAPLGLTFYSQPDFPTKGCYTKEGSDKAFFSLGRKRAAMSGEDLPGVQKRIWCECEDDSNDLLSIQQDVDTSGSSGGQDKETADRDFPINYFDEREGIEDGLPDSAAAASGMISFGVAAAAVTASLLF